MVSNLIDRVVTRYLLLAFGLSWLVEVPLALQAQGVINTDIPFSIHYLAAYGPLLAALIVTWMDRGRAGLRDLGAGLTRWRIGGFWWVVAIAPALLAAAIAGVQWLVSGATAEFPAMGKLDALPDLGLGAALFWIVTFGLGEETGWRGFLLPRLQVRLSPLKAATVVWAFWALWHLPLFFYTYEVSMLPGFLFGLLSGSLVFAWMYNGSGGSILVVAVGHGLFNFATACTACKTGAMAAVVSTVVMVWAVILVVTGRVNRHPVIHKA